MTQVQLRKVVKQAETEQTGVDFELHLPPTASIPNDRVLAKYEGREFHGYAEFDIFDYARATGRNILVEGPTGDGKTMASMAYAVREQLLFYSIPCNGGIDPAQIFGQWMPTGPDTAEWVDGGLTTLVREGGVLLINEINMMPAKLSAAIFSLLDHRREVTLMQRRGEVIKAHIGGGQGSCWCSLPAAQCNRRKLLIVADQNAGYAGTAALNAALRNRFAIQLAWDYDPVVEAKLVKSRVLREDIATGLRQQLRDGKIFTPCSTNMLMEFVELALALNLGFAISNFVNHFDADERHAVSLVFETHRSNLETEFAEMDDTAPDNPDGHHMVFNDPGWIYTMPGQGATA